jgi:CHAT domain-containing protein
MSLWKVNDYSTKLLMMEFYKNYLSGISKHESLNKAQKYVREYKNEDGEELFKNPSYWAGWILLDALN